MKNSEGKYFVRRSIKLILVNLMLVKMLYIGANVVKDPIVPAVESISAETNRRFLRRGDNTSW